jgi:signal transduction histidine kinase/ActR/RegA family two-component response regulator
MSDPAVKEPGRNSIQIRVGFLMILAVILLSAAFYMFYRNLSSIVSSIKIDESPELKLVGIRDISTGIEKAGNSVRIYMATRNPADIRPYYTFISGIDEDITRLKEACNNDSVLLAQTDTIINLIRRNISIWTQLLVLSRDDNIIRNLRSLSISLDSASGTPVGKGSMQKEFRLSPDTAGVKKEPGIDYEEIITKNQMTRDQLAVRELQLARNSSVITEKFYDLLSGMEDEVYYQIGLKADEAQKVAGETYRGLVLVAITGILLGILVIYVIFRYSRNAIAYQAALEKSRDETEKLAKTRELFMANITHEIRTPLTAISGFTEQLLHDIPNSESSKSLNIIKSSSDHLLRIIDNILDFSKLKTDKLTLEKVHFRITGVLEEVHEMLTQKAARNKTRLNYILERDTPPVIIGDPYRLKQILLNLTGNSIKFTINGEVTIRVTHTRKNTEEIELILSVADTGIGIDESKLEAIFDDFTQAEMNTTRKYGGTGLGLSIVKSLIRLHEGNIEVKSKKNEGTTMICRIPYRVGEEKQVKTDHDIILPVPEEIAGKKILVVDDEEYNRLLFSKILRRWKAIVRLAENGMEALEILKSEKFDFAFMDMRMPGIDGLKTTRFIREEMQVSKTEMPLIFISAAPGSEDKEKYRQAGINAFLPKPFSEKMLLSAIMEATDLSAENPSPAIDDPGGETTGEKVSIDVRNLYHLSGGDNIFVKQMLDTFISSTARGLDEMAVAAGKAEWEKTADISHKIQPPCRHIGANTLFGLLSRIERSIRKEEKTDQIEKLTESALREFEVIKRLIEEEIIKTGRT